MEQESKVKRFSSLSMQQKFIRIKAENQQCINLFKTLYNFKNCFNQLKTQLQPQLRHHQTDLVRYDFDQQSRQLQQVDLKKQSGKNQFLSTLFISKMEQLNDQKSLIIDEQFSLGVSKVFQRVTLKQQSNNLTSLKSDSGINIQVKLNHKKAKFMNQVPQQKIIINLDDKDNGKNYSKALITNNDFSLSNFNSFNNNQNVQKIKEPYGSLQDGNNNFESLIFQIQRRFDKKLTQKGVIKIIESLGRNLHKYAQSMRKDQKHNQFQVTILGQKKIELNKKEITKKSEQKSLSAAKRVLFLKDKQNRQTSFYQHQSQSKSNQMIKNNIKLSKEGKGLSKKSLKIIRNNRSSHLEYNDNRDIQQYCITNKIFGKNKKMIMWAIQNQRPIITLDRQ